MQNAAFAALGLDARYDARDVAPSALEAALASLHAEGYVGLNLTSPLKETVWPLLRAGTPEAEALRSVNTLKRLDAGWEGHATDGLGFAAWARESSLVPTNARVILVGSGGAARAVAPYLARLGAATVTVVARDASRAATVTALGERQNGGTAWSAMALAEACESGPYDLLVRTLTIPALVAGEAGWWSALAAGAAVVDLNYGDRADTIRRVAVAAGLRHADGLGMLLHQGALSFTYWTGLAAPVDVMRHALEAATAG
jgi:shikimate dehydrogenase